MFLLYVKIYSNSQAIRSTHELFIITVYVTG